MIRAERIVDITDHPDLMKVVEEVEASGEPTRLERDGQPVARIVPTPKRRRRPKPADRMTLTDLIGMYASTEPSDIAKYKHEYIAQAILGEKTPDSPP